MHEKLIKSTGFDGTEQAQPPGHDRTRLVPLPPGLSAARLEAMTPEEIADFITTTGRAVGLAALVKLACGVGGTPANTQAAAARFLVEQAAAVESGANDPQAILIQMLGTDAATLQALVDAIDRQQAAQPVALPVIDGQPVDVA